MAEIFEEGDESMDVNNEAEVKPEVGKEGGDENVLQFLDSLDGYLTLMDSLNSKLREGWFDLASARHSMGTLRINSTLLDLKYHPAASTLQVTDQEVESLGSVPHFALSKWASKGGSGKGKDLSTDTDSEIGSPLSPQLRHRGFSEKPSAKDETILVADEEIKKERAKSLSVFGGLVSPKLRGAQLSFETALETLVEIANMRASMLSAFERIKEK
ncbi:coiled-coil domain-containing protein 115 isoform X2 [Arabidopsis lyrata subsp. lyrata]|uniref:coiled-coil domain-containing protein 115 isoform X2 n=1 Tax=Arabidopsis lyrata subsp. lyrata TaxID=81972 RepID=UPI000A29B6AA|nr:coiled-coil domain-containing protein 115 isoform X2 [Arabidopsis lyrata subsp. lyrata]|eukprot:XP_020869599.1 coiled-coil domain-containing protein 115 isoform X2 [Arabidopsis lyrata subsp. lyrata]